MVARIDLERLRKLNSQSSSPEWKRAQRVLWDSGSVHDLIELPLSRVHFPPAPDRLMLYSFAHVMAGKEEAERMMRQTPLGEEQSWYVPELFFFEGEHFASRGWEYYCDKEGKWNSLLMLFFGEPFIAGSAQFSADGVEAQSLQVNPEAWTMLSRIAQAAEWCITYPEQFPILRRAGLSSKDERNKAKRRDIEKTKLVLPDVQIIEMRPRITEGAGLRPSTPTGRHRDYHYSFEVSGHIRHLKSGKTTYVAPHWKAVDKPRLERMTVKRF